MDSKGIIWLREIPWRLTGPTRLCGVFCVYSTGPSGRRYLPPPRPGPRQGTQAGRRRLPLAEGTRAGCRGSRQIRGGAAECLPDPEGFRTIPEARGKGRGGAEQGWRSWARRCLSLPQLTSRLSLDEDCSRADSVDLCC